MQKAGLIAIVIIVIAAACSSSVKTTTGTSAGKGKLASEVMRNALENNLTNRDFFISRGKIATGGDAGHISLLFTIKYKAPGIYLISLRSRAGIEAYRIFIDSDTILINDRINRTLLTGKSSDFERIAGIPVQLLKVSLGDCFVNNPLMQVKETCSGNETRISDYFPGLIIKTTLDCNISKAVSLQLTTGITEEYININYRKHRDDINRTPRIVEINDFRRKIKIRITISKYMAPWYGDIEFIPGSGYKIQPLI